MDSNFRDDAVDVDSTKENSREEASNHSIDTSSSSEGDTTTITENSTEEPPKFKYTRLSRLPPRIFNKDPVSACCFSEDAFIIGTHSGLIHICHPDFKPIRTFKAHMASIFSIRSDNEYFASASLDGTIVIGSLKDSSDITKFDFKRPLYSVALDKNYRTTKAFFSGGTSGKLIHSTRNWLGQRQDTILNEGDGPITLIEVMEDLVFWTNDTGIHAIQLSTQKSILDIKFGKESPEPGIYWPRAHIVDRNRIVIACASHVWFLKITVIKHTLAAPTKSILSSAASSILGNMTEISVSIEQDVELPGILVSGISEFEGDLLVLNYCLPKTVKDKNNDKKQTVGQPAELVLIDETTFEEKSVDVLSLHGFEGLGFNDYHLYQHNRSQERPMWFLVSATDGVIVEQLSLKDRLYWYTNRGNYLKAWDMSKLWLDRTERLDIGIKQANQYISDDDWGDAAAFISEMLTVTSKDDQNYIERVIHEWNSWLQIYLDTNHLDDIINYIPASEFTNHETVDTKYYNAALERCLLQSDYDKLLQLTSKWNHNLFDCTRMIDLIQKKLEVYDSTHPLNQAVLSADPDPYAKLRKMLVGLLLEAEEPDKCVDQLLRLKGQGIIQFLDEQHLLQKNLDKLPLAISVTVGSDILTTTNIADLRKELISEVDILVETSHEIAPSVIVKVFRDAKMDSISYLYLEKLNEEDPALTSDLEDEMVRLYAVYNRQALSKFLSTHRRYSIDKAITICENERCISELAFLFSKVGQNKKALMLIIDELDDPAKAIQFAVKVNDKELWNFLLDYSMEKPDFITALLGAVGDLIDSVSVVSRIPLTVAIPNLKGLLLGILQNVELDDIIYKLILQIISKDAMAISQKELDIKLKGYNHTKLSNRFRTQGSYLIFKPDKSEGFSVTVEAAGTSASKIEHIRMLQASLLQKRGKN